MYTVQLQSALSHLLDVNECQGWHVDLSPVQLGALINWVPNPENVSCKSSTPTGISSTCLSSRDFLCVTFSNAHAAWRLYLHSSLRHVRGQIIRTSAFTGSLKPLRRSFMSPHVHVRAVQQFGPFRTGSTQQVFMSVLLNADHLL